MMPLSAVLIGGLVAAVHVGVLLVAFTGPRARFLGGIAVIAVNYGLRRLLFLDPALGGEPAAWFGLILLGDFTLLLLVVMSLALRANGEVPRLHRADVAVGALLIASVLLAVGDGRVPLDVRAAHWKEEYVYLAAYVLARLNGPAVLDRGPGVLAIVAVAAVAVALWQALAGPLPVDMAWIASGRSVLARDPATIIGAHGLGNLDAGWLRPYGFFGNGTDFGVFLAAVALLAVGVRGRLLALARPLPLICALGIILSVVRITWLVLALGVAVWLVLGAAGPLRRTARAGILAAGLALAAVAFFLIAPMLADSGSLWGRAFVLGTYGERFEAQAAMLAHLAANPALLLTGEGFGGFGSAAIKFGFQAPGPGIAHHSRLFDLVQDGGLLFLALVLAPLILALRGGAAGDGIRAAGLAFCVALLLSATVLGAKSALLQTLYWGLLGVAVNRAPGLWRPLPLRRASAVPEASP